MTAEQRRARALVLAYREYVRTGRAARTVRPCTATTDVELLRVGSDSRREQHHVACELLRGHFPRTMHRGKVAQRCPSTGLPIMPVIVEWPRRSRH